MIKFKRLITMVGLINNLPSNPGPEMARVFLCLENEKKEKGTGDKQHATRHKLR